ncbi:MAG: MmgE/PrpD family protein [Deltaproteobacteria bacterium]|nr:MmgE/PrpD family protein [Deltaproteobacteria bacterium]MBW2067045.1 MmgE/PrpD family protein [Deltaproteobacteria bacterium]
METISSKYADFVSGLSYEDLDSETISDTKKLILDLVGVSLAGYRLMEFPQMVVKYFADMGGSPEATIIQTKKKFPAVNAAMANASCAHALDMDDGHRFGALHPGAAVIPAAIAAAELSHAGPRELITGIVVGYEVMIRVGMAIVPSSLSRGFHITGIAGPFGSAAASASILGLSREEIIGAFGMAGLQASGLIQVNHEIEGAKVKPINPASASMSGLLSCLLARKGARGPFSIFEGEDGYLRAFSDEDKRDLLTRDLGERFEIHNVYIKLYAGCRHAHAPMDAALEAFRKSEIAPSTISKIVVETYQAAIRLSGMTDVTTPSAARFSIPFSVALVIVKQDGGADKYCEENVRDGLIQDLSRKVEMAESKKWNMLYPDKRGATVTIFDGKGTSWSAEVGLAKGEPENPASLEEVYRKFLNNAAQLLSPQEAEELGETIMNLEVHSVEELVGLI